MKNLPIVALIGQTNAGKSSLLNRFAHKNIAIVAREEGTTRDNVYARIDDSFLLVDTAGLKRPEDDFEASIQEQIEDAVDSANTICVVVDSTKYFNDKDRNIARLALRSKKPVFLILNKSDRGESLDINEFRALGIPEDHIFRTSATTGQGITELKQALEGNFDKGGSTRGTPSALRASGAKAMGDKSRQDPMLKIQSFLSKSEEATDFIEPDQTVIVDPPRAGLDAKLVNKLLEITPETIIYLSCNPVTQARDVKLLLEKYQIIKIQPFNFFPRTPHLENLIVLERK